MRELLAVEVEVFAVSKLETFESSFLFNPIRSLKLVGIASLTLSPTADCQVVYPANKFKLSS